MDDQPKWLPWWLKIIIGVAGIGILYKFYSLVEAMGIFFTICAVPFGVLFSLNLITQGTYELIASPPWWQDLKTRINDYRSEMQTPKVKPSPSLQEI